MLELTEKLTNAPPEPYLCLIAPLQYCGEVKGRKKDIGEGGKGEEEGKEESSPQLGPALAES